VSRSSRRTIGSASQLQPQVALWGLARVGSWLEDNDLGHVRQEFQRNSVTGAGLLRLTPDDLDRMAITDPTDRAAIFSAVAELRVSGDSGLSARSPGLRRRSGHVLSKIDSEASLAKCASFGHAPFPPSPPSLSRCLCSYSLPSLTRRSVPIRT